jgi:hypothetical protein
MIVTAHTHRFLSFINLCKEKIFIENAKDKEQKLLSKLTFENKKYLIKANVYYKKTLIIYPNLIYTAPINWVMAKKYYNKENWVLVDCDNKHHQIEILKLKEDNFKKNLIHKKSKKYFSDIIIKHS